MWNIIGLKTLGVMIFAAGVGSVLFRKFKVPHVVIYILAGLIIGQFELAFLSEKLLIESQSTASVIIQAGIALLLFLVGMELSLSKVKRIGKEALLAGCLQVALCFLFAFALSQLVGMGTTKSLAIGMALSFSSTVIVVKMLGEKRQMNSLYARVSIGILLVQDLIVILALTLLGGLSEGEGGYTELSFALLKALVGVAITLAFSLFASKFVISKLMLWASSSTESLLVWSLTWCFLIVGLSHFFGLSHEIGAFVAGVSLAQLPLSNSLRQRIHPLVNFFMAIFFIALGMEINVMEAIANWKMALVFVAFTMLIKPLVFIYVVSRQGFSQRTSALTAITMAQISEFSFIFIALAKSSGLVGESEVAIIAFAGLCSFGISSVVIKKNHEVYEFLQTKKWLNWMGIRPKSSPEDFPENFRTGHIIVIGMNSLGREICFKLTENGHKTLAIDNDPKKLENLPCEILVGNADYASILDEASFATSVLVITTLRIEDVNNSIVYRCEKMGIPVAAHGFDSTVIPELKRLGADYIIDSKYSWLKRLIKELESRGVPLP